MKICLVSYANKEYLKKQQILNQSALKFGIEKTILYTDELLKKTSFYKRNKEVLDQPRGAGYWLWKPYVIYEVLKELDEGDILFYIDAGAEIVSNVKPLVDLCIQQKGVLLFNAININKFWTKRDCFVKMGCDREKYWEHPQFMGGYQVYEKNEFSLNFVKEVLKYSQLKGILDDSLSEKENFIGFKEHRHDQSVLTNIAIKYGAKGFRNPSQGGNHLKKKEFRVKGEQLASPYIYSDVSDENSNYGTIFYNKRNASNLKVKLIKLHSKLPNKLKRLIK